MTHHCSDDTLTRLAFIARHDSERNASIKGPANYFKGDKVFNIFITGRKLGVKRAGSIGLAVDSAEPLWTLPFVLFREHRD